jgi:hypothetical protein
MCSLLHTVVNGAAYRAEQPFHCRVFHSTASRCRIPRGDGAVGVFLDAPAQPLLYVAQHRRRFPESEESRLYEGEAAHEQSRAIDSNR